MQNIAIDSRNASKLAAAVADWQRQQEVDGWPGVQVTTPPITVPSDEDQVQVQRGSREVLAADFPPETVYFSR
jgi:hypothetical protein